MALGLLLVGLAVFIVGLVILAVLLRPSVPTQETRVAQTPEPNLPVVVQPSEIIEVSRDQARLLEEIRAALTRMEGFQTAVSGELAHIRQDLKSSAAGGLAAQVRVSDFRMSFRSIVVLVLKIYLAMLLITVVVAGVTFMFLAIFGPEINAIYENALSNIH
jgi:hypothetical protein